MLSRHTVDRKAFIANHASYVVHKVLCNLISRRAFEDWELEAMYSFSILLHEANHTGQDDTLQWAAHASGIFFVRYNASSGESHWEGFPKKTF